MEVLEDDEDAGGIETRGAVRESPLHVQVVEHLPACEPHRINFIILYYTIILLYYFTILPQQKSCIQVIQKEL